MANNGVVDETCRSEGVGLWDRFHNRGGFMRKGYRGGVQRRSLVLQVLERHACTVLSYGALGAWCAGITF